MKGQGIKPQIPLTSYWIDDNDVIVQVCSQWDRFALENDGGSVLGDCVIGKRIWPFISDDTTRMWLEALLGLARLTGTVVERPYRCDSPRERRYMKMAISREDSGRICLRHEVLRTEQKQYPTPFRCRLHTGHGILVRCSICNRLKAGQRWTESDAWPAAATAPSTQLSVNYSVCPECRAQIAAFPGPPTVP